ncbi:rhodanese-like domain-containing protein [Ancylobacter terrae]|uniref:rhodanese-like domain-containing protein n=1 Tax=Ancylobacter sp. sgz301288 TaxID=3342077 RepID=UPI00385A2ED5
MTVQPEARQFEGENAIATLTPAALHAAIREPGETAVVDVREGGRFEAGHVSVAVPLPLPLGELELHVERLLPRRSIRLVVTDDEGGALGRRAVRRLHALGYGDVALLAGGLAAWAAEGFELITGQYSLSKALGEFVERRYHTPRIGVRELEERFRSGGDLVVLDTRPLEEFHHISIPGGVAAPGAELLYRVFDAVPSPDTPVVINCAGRTRAIIGAQALLNAGFPNPVVSLENGTSAWILAGLEPGRGATEKVGPPSPEGLARARAAAARIAERFGVRRIDAGELARLRAEANQRSLYLLDVRTPEEFLAGHLPGTLSAPGGQVVQTTDSFIGTRDGIVVLVDDEDGVLPLWRWRRSRRVSGGRVLALAGGTQSWVDERLEFRSGVDQPALVPEEALPPLPTLAERRVALEAYVRWGDGIVDQLERDGLVRFRAFD